MIFFFAKIGSSLMDFPQTLFSKVFYRATIEKPFSAQDDIRKMKVPQKRNQVPQFGRWEKI